MLDLVRRPVRVGRQARPDGFCGGVAEHGKPFSHPVALAQHMAAIAHDIGIAGFQCQSTIETFQRFGETLQHPQGDAPVLPGVGVVRVYRQRSVEIGQRRLFALECVQRIAAIDQRTFMVGAMRQHLIIACHGVGRTLHQGKGVGAVEMGVGEIRLQHQHAVIAGQRVLQPSQQLEHIAAIEQRVWHIRPDRQRAFNQRQRLGIAALLRPHHAQQMARHKGLRVRRNHLPVQPLCRHKIAALVRRDRLFLNIHRRFVRCAAPIDKPGSARQP